MNVNDIIQQGTMAKYAVSISYDGFDADTDDFAVTLLWGMRGSKLTISKSDMRDIKDGRWLMAFDTTEMTGPVTAIMMAQIPDSDISGDLLQEVDRQVISFVVSTPNPRLLTCPAESTEQAVTYERITEPGVADNYRYLRDSNQNRIRTANGDFILVVNG